MERSFATTLFLAAALAAASRASAQAAAPAPPSIRVSGEAVVQEKPDQAEIEVGVTTTAPRAPDATAENARRVDAVTIALKKLLGVGADVQTAGYSLSPNQKWPEGGGTPTITGYTAANVIRVRTTELEKVGPVIDAALEAGANQVQGLRFSLKDEERTRARALALAAERALAKAKVLAGALGVKLGRIRSVEEGASGGPPILMRDAVAFKAERSETPIESGELDVTATVSLTVEIEQ